VESERLDRVVKYGDLSKPRSIQETNRALRGDRYREVEG
jgi:hypothetical protein